MSEPTRALQLSTRDHARLVEIEAIASRGDVAALLAALDDPSWAVRRAVVGAVARLGDPALPGLVDLLRHRRDNEARIAAAVDALAATTARADTALATLAAEAPEPAVLCDVAQIFGRRRSAGAIDWLAAQTAHADDNVALAAIEALGRIGHGAGVDALITIIGSGNFFRTFPAIEVLGQSGDPRATLPLVALVEQPLYTLAVTRALGNTGDERAVATLASRLADRDPDLVRAAARSLVELHDRHAARHGNASAVLATLRAVAPSTLDALIAVLPGGDAADQIASCRVLEWLGAVAATHALFALLDAAPPVAAAAEATLRRFGDAIGPQLDDALNKERGEPRLRLLPLVGGRRANLAAVLACLGDPEPSVRALACHAVGRMGDARCVDALFERLVDGDSRVVLAAVSAIQSLGGLHTEELALRAARSTDLRVRRAALRIIAYFGYPAGLDALLLGMRADDERLRDVAIGGLAFLEDERASAALLYAASHASPKTRAAAMRAIGQAAPSAEGTVTLRRGITDADAWVRYYACQSLGKLHDNGAASAIVSLLNDSAGQVRVAAIDALAQIEAAQPQTEQSLTAPRPAFAALWVAARSEDPDMQRAALLGLATSRHAESLTLLLEAAREGDPATRLIALAGLVHHASPDVEATLAFAGGDPSNDESVRRAAIAHLASRPGAAATVALCELVASPVARADALLALGSSPGPARLEGIQRALQDADETTAPLLVGVLARHGAFEIIVGLLQASVPPAARAAAAEVLGAFGTRYRDALERAAVDDPDPLVRRACALAVGE